MKFVVLNIFLVIALAFGSCQIPQIEDARCTASRETARKFFAQHLQDTSRQAFTREALTSLEKFLTPEFYQVMQKDFDRHEKMIRDNPLENMPNRVAFANADPITGPHPLPTGYKVGECKTEGDFYAIHAVQMFWTNDDRPLQRELKVKIEKRGDQWLISDFINDKNESLFEMFSRKDL